MGMDCLKFHIQLPLSGTKLSCLPLPRQDVSDDIVQLKQPDVAAAWELLLIQDK